jgi:hypothetical protein
MDIHGRTCALLRKARNLTFQWINEIRMKSDSSQDEALRSSLQHRICMLAMTCFSTFDVSLEHIQSVLDSEENFSIAMQCAVIVHETMPPPPSYVVHEDTPPSSSDDTSLYFNRMLSRHRRLLHNLEPLFSQPLPSSLGRARLRHAGAYNDALARLGLVSRQCKSLRWHALPKQNPRWIFCVTEGGQSIHYDLLTGELLISGRRLGRLPHEIVKHPTYTNLFGAVSGPSPLFSLHQALPEVFQRGFDVAPADVRGMDYMTRFTVSGYQVKLYSCSAFGSANTN